MRLHTSPQDFLAFSDYKFKAGRWYHVTISHELVVKNSKKPIVKLFVNGLQRQQGFVNFPIRAGTWKAYGRFGASMSNSNHHEQPSSQL